MGLEPPSNRTARFNFMVIAMVDEIDYDSLIKKALKNVVKDALKFAQENGVSNNHFYITFRTDANGVKIPELLKEQYPKSMTIVLQHQFENLTVDDKGFSVDLSFGGVPYSLVITFASVTYFADPYAKFGLSFAPIDDEDEEEKSSEQKAPAEVISIDSFRKK